MEEHCIFEIKSTLDNTSDDPERQPDFVNSLVRQVADLSCPGEPSLCSGHGTCTRGRCVCNAGTLKRVQTHVLLCVFLKTCPEITAKITLSTQANLARYCRSSSKQMNESRWVLAWMLSTSYPTLRLNEIIGLLSPKIRVLSSGTSFHTPD